MYRMVGANRVHLFRRMFLLDLYMKGKKHYCETFCIKLSPLAG
jgi:hypothetical protein